MVGTLTRARHRGDTVAEIAHDARNMVTAMSLYCDLLEEPGVLAERCLHYAGELRLIAAASRSLVERLVKFDAPDTPQFGPGALTSIRDPRPAPASPWLHADRLPSDSIDNLQQELAANSSLLDALSGLSISVTVRAEAGAHPVRISGEDLTRILVNLVKNAAEAMRQAGRIEIALNEVPSPEGPASRLVLTVEDTGPGFPAESLEKVFEPGYTTHTHPAENGWPPPKRGLGLSITRSIVEAAGGAIRAENRAEGGARILIELPIRSR